MKIKTYILIFLIFFSVKGFTQTCGGGTLTFNVYTLNGEEIDEFEYEIFPVSGELLRKNLYEKVVNKANLDNDNYSLYRNVNDSGIIISEHFANEIIETNDEKLNENLQKLLHKISQKGKIKSTLLFTTFETIDFPIILKISNKKRTIYILGNYFGGCNREASLTWSKGYVKLN